MRKQRSLGEMITHNILGCGVFIFLYGMELLNMGHHLRAYIGFVAAFLYFRWIRFAIFLVNKWRKS